MTPIMWIQLKKYIVSKNSHGKTELLNAMLIMEIESITRLDEIESNSGESER